LYDLKENNRYDLRGGPVCIDTKQNCDNIPFNIGPFIPPQKAKRKSEKRKRNEQRRRIG